MLAVSGGLIGGLAIAGFIVAVLAALVTPILARASSLEAWRGPVKLVPYALPGAGGNLAGAAAILGTVTAPQPGVREIAAAALTILCLTPLIGAIAVRLRFGAPGKRTFHQQIAAAHPDGLGSRAAWLMLPTDAQPGKPRPRRWAGRRLRCQVFSIVFGPRRASTALRA